MTRIATLVIAVLAFNCVPTIAAEPTTRPAMQIHSIDPTEGGFYAKRLDYEGIPIKSSSAVVDEAFFEAHRRLAMLLKNLPTVRQNLVANGAELHIIGRDEQPSDLPELREFKGKPWDGKLTIDERTRGVSGKETSCGEENLLRLEKDRYRGRDICVHEFAHSIRTNGSPASIKARFDEQFRKSLEKGLWVGSYAGSNPDEFFAELTMWYFGTHGDLGMKGPKPANGPEGLKAYDPDAYALFDDFYAGRMDIPLIGRE